MTFDLFTALAFSALVVNVSGIIFIVDTLLRRDEGAGRIWALASLGGMLTTLSYVVWAQNPEAMWAIAAGNAAFATTAGCVWLGCRRFNGQPMMWASVVVVAGVAVVAAAVFIEGRAAGDWAGVTWMFGAVCVFAGAGAAECIRGDLRASRAAWVLAAVLAFESLFYAARTIIFVVAGPDSTLFSQGFGSIAASAVTVTLTIVAVVVTSVLRAARAPMRGAASPAGFVVTDDGILSRTAFDTSMTDLCDRAGWRSETVGVIALRIDDFAQISTAFGGEVVRALTEVWRTGVRRHAPSLSFVAEDGEGGLLVGLLVDSDRDARLHAGAIYRGLFDDLGMAGSTTDGDFGGVIPVVGVGVALSDTTGYDVDSLVRVARAAARRAATNVDASVLVGDAG